MDTYKANFSDILQHLISVEKKLNDFGYNIEKLTGVGPVLTEEDGKRMTMQEIRERITVIVNKLKSSCRVDERVYEECGRLVHIRIRTREASLNEWLYSDELRLKKECRDAIEKHMQHIEKMLGWFYSDPFKHYLLGLGLQSALKYEETYLARLGNDRQESLGQFFVRLATAVTQQTIKDTVPAEVLTCSGKWVDVFDVYFMQLSQQKFIPATPAMLYLGRNRGSTASCYLLDPKPANTTEAVNALVREVTPILQARGGVGLCLQKYNTVSGDRGNSKGLAAALKLLDSLVMAINSDSDRPTGVCVYIEPWHAAVRAMLNMKGLLASEESLRCDHVFGALWMCDLFFKRYAMYAEGKEGIMWTLFDDRASHLSDLYGEDFEREYERLEAAGIGVESIPIRDMAFSIVRSAAMTGSPFIMFKDACNRHYHLDMKGRALSGSNLCTEIVHQADETSNGVCNLASVNLPRFIRNDSNNGKPVFDFCSLRSTVKVATMFVNAMMECSDYPTENSRRGVDKHRSMGIGMQGLHTTFLTLGYDMSSREARILNSRIAENMLLAAMTASCELCKRGMTPFLDFYESKYARGELHFDGWDNAVVTEVHEWSFLREQVMKHGLYNSQFIALMPTVSSSQVSESSEGFSPLFTNMFSKVTMSGELLRPNLMLMQELRALFPCEDDRMEAIRKLESNQWSVSRAFGELADGNSLQKYKTAFEYSQDLLVDMCADRAPFVDHSQSMTLYITERADGTLPASSIMNLLMRAYKLGLKTGMYYCKIRKATNNGIFSGSGELVCTSCHL
ncbi:ribonucleotide reductase subunit 1 [Spheniscid alphaherpesvirus 1]|uniref:Ribonucleoside-diphosphate reductase large subunit n=1 Tax=Spheniscid alphaherpesvirus 1 TaxID=2560777 RepID=A0A1R3T415_9ALPH|nr:ribonucleotide reductase subunit 1 [Spheniscid alphaherpesvirus 1]SCO83523.1 ribonucleotide reductase subunit 1 [Spheniscid alphaherpesvirus 1]